MDQDAALEPAKVLERSLEDPPIKRKPIGSKKLCKMQRDMQPFQEPSEKAKGLIDMQGMWIW